MTTLCALRQARKSLFVRFLTLARIASERREEPESAIPALHLFIRDQQLQQTGMLFMHMQQTQPAAHMEAMQSQQA
ncbi:MAG: hypothetical protein WBX00_23010, partial [Isosphaeraceae bacterium]